MGRRVSMFGRPEGDGRVREVRRLCIVMGSHTQVHFIPTQLKKTYLSLGWNISVLIVKKRCTKSGTGGSGYDLL